MQTRLPIALDAMGGDHGPGPNVEGALAAIRLDGTPVILVGDEALLRKEVEVQGGADLLNGMLSLRHAPEVVAMDEKPSQAVRRKRGSSMRVAADLVKSGEAAAVVSAGNSGAMMAVGLLVFGRIEGVLRPAIATAFPSPARPGFSMLIDAGANIECAPEHLFQFGLMGDAYLRAVVKHPSPNLGVMANGTEDSKGTDLTRGALALLRQTDLNVLGHIEGNQILNGNIDVVVTDGFTGNVLLKTSEAVAHYVGAEIKRAFVSGGPLVKLAGLVAKSALKKVATRLDAREAGAAPLLGLAAPAFIAHGHSDGLAIRRAIGVARTHADAELTRVIEDQIKRWAHLVHEPSPVPSKQA
ncbi:MAG: phosphate acyltransferase PlsX [Myxococcota bacterium]